MGSFPREWAWPYLFTFLAWLIGWLVVVLRYGGHEVVTTPVQGLGPAGMFGASAVICRIAWILTRESDGPPRGSIGSFHTTRFFLLAALRGWALLLGAGVPAAIRALRRRA